jgi:hypothetical protein
LHFRDAARKKGFRVKFLPTSTKDSYKKKHILEQTLNLQIDFLLLAPDAKEGVDIPGIRVFHILEPCKDIITHKQLCARVVRYNHESKKKYKVQIYVWNGLDSKIVTKIRTKLRMWNSYGKTRVPWTYFSTLKKLPSPDTMAMENLKRMGKNYDEIQKKIVRLSNINEEKPSIKAHNSRAQIYDPTK